MNTFVFPLPRELQQAIWSFNDTTLLQEEYKQLCIQFDDVYKHDRGYHPIQFIKLKTIFDRFCQIVPPIWKTVMEYQLQLIHNILLCCPKEYQTSTWDHEFTIIDGFTEIDEFGNDYAVYEIHQELNQEVLLSMRLAFIHSKPDKMCWTLYV